MKISSIITIGPVMWLHSVRTFRNLFAGVAMLTTGALSMQAQDTTAPLFTRPTWWFGAAGGANFNFYEGSTQKLNADHTIPATFHKGTGIGLFLGPLVEFHRPGSRWGWMFQAGYDNRKGEFDQILTPCDCPADLSTKVSYITVEPSLRFAPFKGNFYMYAGPRIALLMDKSFLYKQHPNPAYSDQVSNPDVQGDLSDMNNTIISMQIGAGYDIMLSSTNRQTQWALSPFVSYHPYFGQDPRSIESWNITTVRAGLAIKFGRGRSTSPEQENEKVAKSAAKVEVIAIAAPDVKFSIHAPANIPVERRVRETFPLRNYVFFELGSTQIPDRYVLLKKSEVKDFKEDQLEVFKPKKLSGRSKRQMIAYYNILNIVGDRLGTNPGAKISLIGSSEKGAADGKAMAESIKKYLVETFGIEGGRINTEGNARPLNAGEVKGGTKDLVILAEGNRRVSITSSNPAMLMEFQSGPDAPLKPVVIKGPQEAPLDSYVTVSVEGASDSFKSWTLEVRDEKGGLQSFGPYYQDAVSIPGKAILGSRPSGDYKFTLVGITANDNIVKEEASAHMVLWTPSVDEEGMRFSVLFEYNESQTAKQHRKYLTEVVAPQIQPGSKVIIHGFSDIAGNVAHNQKLSSQRAVDVRNILMSAMTTAEKKDVTFEAFGFGEDPGFSPFENTTPEERFYNRTVVIDIIPLTK